MGSSDNRTFVQFRTRLRTSLKPPAYWVLRTLIACTNLSTRYGLACRGVRYPMTLLINNTAWTRR